ncbi:MAG: TetR/AcrR family transcriptional regulator [Bacteroidia bacterium]
MKETFKNLPTEKQERILDAFLREFLEKDFEHASLSKVVDLLGIAKGSVYQYFGSKLELYQSLQTICQAEKMRYVLGIERTSQPSFWDWYRELFQAGIRFDMERPLHSQFLYRSNQDRSNPQLSQQRDATFRASIDLFAGIVAKEQEGGELSKDFAAEFISLTIVSQSLALRDYLEVYLRIDLGRHISEDNTVFAREAEHIFAFVDQSIAMLKLAFTPTSQS